MSRIVVGMSGGVDSSVAALLLKEEGHDVIGVSMKLVACDGDHQESCCTPHDRDDARAVCERLDIPHMMLDVTALFRREVIDPFVDAYLAGETPSPCIRCNEYIKFGALINHADSLGADLVATGHYARIEHIGDRPALKCALDPAKDQSYFLFPTLAGVLARLRFPLGNLAKEQVRSIARERGLLIHDKDESQDICFVPDGDYASFVERMRPAQLPGRGRFVDTSGTCLGYHRGIHAYTVGQRRGLGMGLGRRAYVVRIDRMTNEVVLGGNDDGLARGMMLRGVVWAPGACSRRRATVKIRSAHAGARAVVEPGDDGCAQVTFDEDQRAITPGQAAVFYDGDTVIGGGWIV